MALVFMGNQLSRSSASRTTSHGSFLLFSLCHVVLLAGRALSYQGTPGVDVFTPTSNWLESSICHRHCLILFPSPASHRKEMVNSSGKRIILVSSEIWLLAW